VLQKNVVFLKIYKNDKIQTRKIMQFNPETGRRITPKRSNRFGTQQIKKVC